MVTTQDLVDIKENIAENVNILQIFLQILSRFSIDSYVVTIRWNRLDETITMNGNDIGFNRD